MYYIGGQIANPMSANLMSNAMTVNAANLRNAIPQVQVIPQMHNAQFMQQFPYNQQQQIMFQNAAAMQGWCNCRLPFTKAEDIKTHSSVVRPSVCPSQKL